MADDEEVDLVYNVDNNSLVCSAGIQTWVYTYCIQAPPTPTLYLKQMLELWEALMVRLIVVPQEILLHSTLSLLLYDWNHHTR